MKLTLGIDLNLVAMMQAEINAGERAVSAAILEASSGLKSDWRRQITGAGLGDRLARTIRSAQYPKGKASLNAAALVWSNAPMIVGAHETGPLIRSKSGLWLAIPTAAAGKSTRGGRITPREWEQRLSIAWSQPAGGRGQAQQPRPWRCLARENRSRNGYGANLSAGSAGQTYQTAGSVTVSRDRSKAHPRCDCCELD